MQKHVNLVDLVKSFPTKIYLQKSASIQPRTIHLIFIILAASRDSIFTERSSPFLPSRTVSLSAVTDRLGYLPLCILPSLLPLCSCADCTAGCAPAAGAGTENCDPQTEKLIGLYLLIGRIRNSPFGHVLSIFTSAF